MLTSARISVEIMGRPCQLAFDMAAAYWLERTHQLSFDKIAAARAQLRTRQDKLEFVRKLVHAMTQGMAEPLTDREASRLIAEDLLELAVPIQRAIDISMNGLPLHTEGRDSEPAAAVEKLAWDWGRALLEAVDRLRLGPREFWQLTFAEFTVMLQAVARREDREKQFTAAMVVNIVNTCSLGLKRPLTVDALLGRKEKRRGRSFADMDPGTRKKAWGALLKKARAQKRKGKRKQGAR